VSCICKFHTKLEGSKDEEETVGSLEKSGVEVDSTSLVEDGGGDEVAKLD